jgi:hypothetical protein
VIELPTTRNHLPELLRRLDEGWSIEEPLLHRSVVHGWDGRRSVFEVVICRDVERRALALVDDPDVEQFLTQRCFAILEV